MIHHPYTAWNEKICWVRASLSHWESVCVHQAVQSCLVSTRRYSPVSPVLFGVHQVVQGIHHLFTAACSSLKGNVTFILQKLYKLGFIDFIVKLDFELFELFWCREIKLYNDSVGVL